MRLSRLEVRNFRCLESFEMSLCDLTVLIGGNNTGKSSVLDVLDLALGQQRPPDPKDYYCSDGGEPCEEIAVTLEFAVDEEGDVRAHEYSIGNTLRLRKTFAREGAKREIWVARPLDPRLSQDFAHMNAADQKALMDELDPDAQATLERNNATTRAEWLRSYAACAPSQECWAEVAARALDFLPSFYRYRTIDYRDPSGIVRTVVQQIYERLVYEELEDGSRQPIEPLRQLQARVQDSVTQHIEVLKDYITRYDNSVRDVSFDPMIDFGKGFGGGEFLVDCGRGLHYLSRVGDGTKRRMLLATIDWDLEVTRLQAQSDTPAPSVIRAYDEPDTNLDYEAQRRMYRGISGLVRDDGSRLQVIICTHSPPMIDRVPAQNVRLLRISEGSTRAEQLETDDDSEVEDFLTEFAQELGITNTLMFYERCFVLVEGETEESALPILYRTAHGHSMLEDGIRIINVRSNGAVREFLRLMSRNRQELVLVFIDNDCHDGQEARLTEDQLRQAGFDDAFIASRVVYAGQREYEDAFSDEVIARALNDHLRKATGEWTESEISDCRAAGKFSAKLCSTVYSGIQRPVSKPELAVAVARTCQVCDVPAVVSQLFDMARQVSGCCL